MVRRKPVLPLRQYCIKCLPKLFSTHARKMAHKASAMKWFGIFEGLLDVDKDKVIQYQVESTRNFIFENVLWYDHEDVFR